MMCILRTNLLISIYFERIKEAIKKSAKKEKSCRKEHLSLQKWHWKTFPVTISKWFIRSISFNQSLQILLQVLPEKFKITVWGDTWFHWVDTTSCAQCNYPTTAEHNFFIFSFYLIAQKIEVQTLYEDIIKTTPINKKSIIIVQ